MENLSRRDMLTAAAVTISLPLLEAATGTLRPAGAAATMAPGGARNGGGPGSQPAEVPGWFATTLKPGDVKEDEFTAVDGHKIILSRSGKDIIAFTAVCTHKGCVVPTKAGAKIITCRCHGAQYNLDGSVAKGPANKPLQHFAIRVNDKGLIEIDPGQIVEKDAREAKITVA